MKRRLQTLTLALLLGSATLVEGEQIETSLEADLEEGRKHGHGKKELQSLFQQNHKQKATKGNKGFHTKTLREYHDETRPEDKGRIMEIFYNSYDHLDHSIHEVEQDMDRIKVMSTKNLRKNGRKCNPLDWVTLHWKTYVDTGHKLEDSREFKDKQPAVFEIGMYQVPKCWDITAAYMHAGQLMKVSCPSYLAYGGAPKYGHYDRDVIPADMPVVFELEVLECQQGIDNINQVNKKAKNNAPWVYRRGKNGPRCGPGQTCAGEGEGDGEKPDAESAASKKDMGKIKAKVTKMKKTITGQKKKLQKDEAETKKMEDDIEKGDGKDQEENAKKMMIKQEKVIKEEKIIKREKKQVKSVKKLIKKAENPKAAKKEEDAKNKQKNPEDKPAEKGAKERQVDAEGKFLVPDPPPFDCFYIKYPQKDSKGNWLVLEADTKDKYAPKKTGLYNFFLHPLGNTEEEEAEADDDGHHANHEVYQQWHYDTTTHKLSIKAFSNKVMFQGNNRNLVLYADKNMKNQFFSFDKYSGVWYNEYSSQGIMIDHASEIESGANIITGPKKNKKNLSRMHWRMVPCDEVTKKEGHHDGKGHEEKEKDGDHEEKDDDHDEKKDDDHHDEDGDEKEEDDDEDHHDEEEKKEKEADQETDDDDHDASKNEADLKQAKEVVKTIVDKKKKESLHESSEDQSHSSSTSSTSTSGSSSTTSSSSKSHSSSSKSSKKSSSSSHEKTTTQKASAAAEKNEDDDHEDDSAAEKKDDTEEKEAEKPVKAAASQKEDKKKKKQKKKEVTEEEKQKEVEKDEEEDEKLDQKKPNAADKADDESSDVDEPVKAAAEKPAAAAASLHQSKATKSKKAAAKKQEKVEKKKQPEKKVEKEDDSDNEEDKPEVEKPQKKMKLTQQKKHKKQKKAKKSKKSEKKHKSAEESDEEDSTDDIMEKFEESLGKDDLGPFESLHQKESKKDASAPIVAAAIDSSKLSKKSKVKSADSDDFDHEKKVAFKKKQGPKEQKKAPKQKVVERITEDEEDRVLEQKLQNLKKLVNE